jgi:hypothetical protein
MMTCSIVSEEIPLPRWDLLFVLTIRQEVEGMLQGMREAGTEMRIDEFGRDFNATDIHAINCYLEVRGEIIRIFLYFVLPIFSTLRLV